MQPPAQARSTPVRACGVMLLAFTDPLHLVLLMKDILRTLG
jgi:hypothetical protein